MRQLIEYWRAKAIRVVIYIDDGIGGAGTFENAVIISQQVKSDLVGCGFTLNKKSVWTPTQQLPWLGHILNFKTGIIAITEEKINKLKQSIRFALSVNRIKVLRLASIAGQIIAMSLAIGSWARLMTRSMFFCISQKRNWSSTVVLNQDAQNELNFWLAKVDQYNGRPMVPQSLCVGVVYSDASDTGFGGYLVKCGKHEVAGSWDIHQLSFSSALKELLAVKYVLISLIYKLSGFSVKWFTDNPADNRNVALVLKIGSKKPHLQHEILQIFNICYPRFIGIDIEWIPGMENEQSDYLSKMYDDNDWGISDTLFCHLETNWGPHTIDRFANYVNTKLPRFNSRYWNPGSESIDAFICDWEYENNYLCPPIPLIPRVLRHAENCLAQGTLVLPVWSSASFWPLLLSDSGQGFAHFIKETLLLPTGKEYHTTGACNSMFGREDLKFDMLALRIDFSKW